jgi:gamma-glutamyltranspeptidase/glutathione hydrolase
MNRIASLTAGAVCAVGLTLVAWAAPPQAALPPAPVPRAASLSTGVLQAVPPQSAAVVAGRSKVASKYGIVAASQPLAARAGVEMLERGGNAVDAAIAASAVMGVVEPGMNGLGGDLTAIVYEAKTGKLYGLNSTGWAPSGLTPERLAAKGITKWPSGAPTAGADPGNIFTVTVPGEVAGWQALRTRFGSLPFATLLAPAIFYADDGFPVTDRIAWIWAQWRDRLAAEPGTAKTYLVNGEAPPAGSIFRNRDLAASLRRVARSGPAGFYQGETAQAILALSREKGGTMTAADLADFSPEWVDPISTTYRGWTVSELPPNTQGVAALMMLNILERFPMRQDGLLSADALHTIIEAKKLAYADMLRYVADPRFGSIPVSAMIAKPHAAERARLIDSARATCDVQPSVFSGLTTGPAGDTIYLATIDKDGNIVSLIQSLSGLFGSNLVPPGTGFALQNRAALFSLQPGHPNVLAPRKRPLHTIIPAFMQKDDVRIGFGIMGGFNQAQAHAQFVVDIVDYGLDIQEALEVPRVNKLTFAGCDINVEAQVPEDVRRTLTARGHLLQVIPPRTDTFGYGQAVMSTGTGVHFGASDPRHDGEAVPEAADLARR